MRSVRAVLALAALAASVSSSAAGKGGDATAERLVGQLGSKKYAERETAARKLDTLGARALPALRDAVRNADLEVRRRAQQILARLERRLDAVRFLAPTRLCLTWKGTPLPQAVRELAARTGLDVRLDGDDAGLASRKLTLDTGDATLWEALDRFCRAAGLSEAPPGDSVNPTADQAADSALVLTGARTRRPPTHLAGSVRLRALPAGAVIPSARRPHPGPDLIFLLEARPEPKVAWQGISRVRVLRAVDEHGQSLVQPEPFLAVDPISAVDEERPLRWDAMWGTPVAALPGRTVPVRVAAGKKAAARLKEVEGVLTARILAAGPLVTVDNVLKAEGRTVIGPGGEMMKLTRARRDGPTLTLHVEARPSASSGAAPFHVVRSPKGVLLMQGGVQTAKSSLDLLDAAGTPLKPVSRERRLNPDPRGGLVLEFTLVYTLRPGQPPPSHLVWTGPRVLPVDIPFLLRDVPVMVQKPRASIAPVP